MPGLVSMPTTLGAFPSYLPPLGQTLIEQAHMRKTKTQVQWVNVCSYFYSTVVLNYSLCQLIPFITLDNRRQIMISFLLSA